MTDFLDLKPTVYSFNPSDLRPIGHEQDTLKGVSKVAIEKRNRS